VADRTAELATKTAELERVNKVFVGRELRMRELKEQIAELEKKRS
jgi:predicted  nucleic acid-binding Zn-ribbon protein